MPEKSREERDIETAVQVLARCCSECEEEVADAPTATECDECGADFTYDEARARAELETRRDA